MRHVFAALAVVALVGVPAAGVDLSPASPPFPLWPIPREARVADTRLLLTEATIVVPPGDARAQYPGRLLAELVADHFGVAIPVAVGVAPSGRTPIVVGEAAAGVVAAAVRRRGGHRARRGRGLPPFRRSGGSRRRRPRLPRRALRCLVLRAARPSLGQAERRRAAGGRPRLALPARSLGAPLPAGPRPARLRPAHHARSPPALQVQRDRAGGRGRDAAREPPRDQRGVEADRRRVVRARRDHRQAGRGHPPGNGAALRGLAPRRRRRRVVHREGRRAPSRGVGRSLWTGDRPRGAGALPHLLHRLRPARPGRRPGDGLAGFLLPLEPRVLPRLLRRARRIPGRAAAEARAHRPRRVAGRRLLPALPRQGHRRPLRRPTSSRSTSTSTRRGSRLGCGATTSWTATTASGSSGRREGSSATSARTRPPPATSSPPRRATSTSSTGPARRATPRSRGSGGRSSSATSRVPRRRTGGAASPATAPSGARCRRGGRGRSSSSASCRSPRRPTAATSSGPSTSRRRKMRSSTWATCSPTCGGCWPRSRCRLTVPTRCASRSSTSSPPSTTRPRATAGTSAACAPAGTPSLGCRSRSPTPRAGAVFPR